MSSKQRVVASCRTQESFDSDYDLEVLGADYDPQVKEYLDKGKRPLLVYRAYGSVRSDVTASEIKPGDVLFLKTVTKIFTRSARSRPSLPWRTSIHDKHQRKA